ncbi:hypothetical protein DD238_008466 [Peronospora effusa]|uniref:Uncharacterized protein n=1 Tax=Peronospora effusa TaxID=542832 RepID=A0A3M6V7V5_9STRA|nr:hypothetical protein DD238_008466 [Peronospora effusa]
MLLMYLTDQNANVFVQMPDFFKRVEKLVTGNSVTLETLKIVLMNQFIGRIGGLLNRNECTTTRVESSFFAFKYQVHSTLLLFVVSSVTNSSMALITLEDTTLVTASCGTGGATTQQTSFDEAIQ